MRKRFIYFLLYIVVLCCVLGPTVGRVATVGSTPREDLWRLLSSIQSFKADFVQTNVDDSIQHGKVVMLKPGKIKWDYDPPVPVSIVVKNNLVTLYDKEIREYTYSKAKNPIFGLLSGEMKGMSNLDVIESTKNKTSNADITYHVRDPATDSSVIITLRQNPVMITSVVGKYGGYVIRIKFLNMQSNVPISTDAFRISLS